MHCKWVSLLKNSKNVLLIISIIGCLLLFIIASGFYSDTSILIRNGIITNDAFMISTVELNDQMRLNIYKDKDCFVTCVVKNRLLGTKILCQSAIYINNDNIRSKGYDYYWQSFQQSALTKTIYWMEWGLIVDRGLTVDSYSVEYPLDYIVYDEYRIFYMTGVYNQDVFYPIEIIPTIACK